MNYYGETLKLRAGLMSMVRFDSVLNPEEKKMNKFIDDFVKLSIKKEVSKDDLALLIEDKKSISNCSIAAWNQRIKCILFSCLAPSISLDDVVDCYLENSSRLIGKGLLDQLESFLERRLYATKENFLKLKDSGDWSGFVDYFGNRDRLCFTNFTLYVQLCNKYNVKHNDILKNLETYIKNEMHVYLNKTSLTYASHKINRSETIKDKESAILDIANYVIAIAENKKPTKKQYNIKFKFFYK
jgi:hypothetical protein